MSKNEVVQAAKNKDAETDVIVTLDDGMRIKIHRVSARLITMATQNLEKPIPPEYVNEQTGQKMSNTSHPEYIRALAEYNKKYEQISLDAMIMFGIELLDEIPKGSWVKNLKRLGIEFDEDDPDELEFYYKTQIAANPYVLAQVSKRTGGLTDAQIEEAFDSFLPKEERSGHQGIPDQGQD